VAAVTDGVVVGAGHVGGQDRAWAYLHGFVSLALSGRVFGGPEQGRGFMLASLEPLFDAQLR
jgi:hypothetical protein